MYARTTGRIDPNSSSVAWVQWEPGRPALLVCWRDRNGAPGKVYRYYPVDAMAFDRLLTAPSKGRHVNWVIKPSARVEGPIL